MSEESWSLADDIVQLRKENVELELKLQQRQEEYKRYVKKTAEKTKREREDLQNQLDEKTAAERRKA
jgi:hypothetical protein